MISLANGVYPFVHKLSDNVSVNVLGIDNGVYDINLSVRVLDGQIITERIWNSGSLLHWRIINKFYTSLGYCAAKIVQQNSDEGDYNYYTKNSFPVLFDRLSPLPGNVLKIGRNGNSIGIFINKEGLFDMRNYKRGYGAPDMFKGSKEEVIERVRDILFK